MPDAFGYLQYYALNYASIIGRGLNKTIIILATTRFKLNYLLDQTMANEN